MIPEAIDHALVLLKAVRGFGKPWGLRANAVVHLPADFVIQPHLQTGNTNASSLLKTF